MSQLVWGKEIMPLGNIVQESHKMQMVSLNSTYIALLLFWEQERIHLCQLLRCVNWSRIYKFWVPLKFGSWSRRWNASLSFLEQINSTVLQTHLDFRNVLAFFVLCGSCTASFCFSFNKDVSDWSPGSPGLISFFWLFLVHYFMTVYSYKIRD